MVCSAGEPSRAALFHQGGLTGGFDPYTLFLRYASFLNSPAFTDASTVTCDNRSNRNCRHA